MAKSTAGLNAINDPKAEWKKNTRTSPGIDFTIPADHPAPEKHPSFSVTNQSDMDGTDINVIMAKYEKTGLVTDLLTGGIRKPVYGDFTGIGNYHDLRIRLARANELFDALPASTRNKFDNDPQNLLDFIADTKNAREMLDLGLITAVEYEVMVPPAPAPEVPPTPAVPAPDQPANPAA
jgi:phage internal scaffolding protein